MTSRDAIAIETPEGVRFSLPLAGVVARALAWMIDVAAIALAVGTISKLLALFSFINPDFVTGLSVLFYFVLSIGYGIALEWFWHGQTLGKRALGIQVLDASGLKLHFSQIAIRNLLRMVDSLPAFYFVGGAASILSSRHQRLGDLAANTIVVERRQVNLPDLAKLNLDEKYNSLLDEPRLAARLRQKISPELVELSVQVLMRREDLLPGVRLQIFNTLAARFKSLVAFPEELTGSMTDERYVRNALQIALTPGGLRAHRLAAQKS